jgi:glycine/D-amino acid oxidase-like deaminating enzyme
MHKEVDYIIVGFGLAGMSFVNILEENNHSFLVFEDDSQTSSHVAGGVYNPVVLKRFTPVWQGHEQLQLAKPFYKKLEGKLKGTYNYTFDTHRVFKSVEEQNNWFAATDKPLLSHYMSTKLDKKSYDGVDTPFGSGVLKNTGRIDVKTLLSDYKKRLIADSKIIFESFDYSGLEFFDGGIKYKNITTKKVIFCEGYGLHKNPYFKHLPMNEAKGELITIYAPDLDVDFLVKAAVFVLPIGDNHYKVGATFNWKDKTSEPSEEGKVELVKKLETFITVPYKIVEQTAGIRPTVKDRRPLVGIHPEHPQLAVLNGLGTRGVMIAPKVSKELYNHIENNSELDTESNITRFNS